ncbi:hypothetical protein Agabi119p4_1939 [Agaricus bisporus var. burnettii]|uniref:AMP-dependent synthetase/ligase domain-containing protein n=1 Tax=Agaricus bisporus var. burnettii TaxID=192524 RepID=A0A8H7F8A6_AGABI|nr:hypothetical protein Agabi119p4_1939 [Agaricus bisporus var. burnettii]
MSWSPARSLAETDAVLCAPGNIHETELSLVDGRLYHVYKNLWPSCRNFWLSAVNQYANQTYIVYEDQRLTYRQVHERAIKVATLFRRVYGLRKGDRVGICSRNCPDYLVIFWACHLIGAVAVLANAWLPVIIVDPERADILEPITSQIQEEAGTVAFLVIAEDNHPWQNMRSLNQAVNSLKGSIDLQDLLCEQIEPEDNATIIFTSGTTGLPKGVLSTQRQFLSNVFNVLVGSFRAALRNGLPLPSIQRQGPQPGTLVAVPLFHVTGSTSYSMMATLTGMKIILSRKWEPEEAARLIREENVGVAGGVPAMVADLIDSSLAGHPLEGLLFGGSPTPDSLVGRARKAFPKAMMTQGYGLSETNSIAVSIAGDDYFARPASTGLACPINEIKIVAGGKCLPANHVGEVWLRGPNVMKGYWNDPETTDRVITKDGWLRSGDLGYLDEEGFLYIKDRLKDVIIRGGENVDSVSVENALYADPRVLEAAAVGVPDERLGELVAAVVSIKPAYQGHVSESALIDITRRSLPRFAVPVMIVVLHEPFEHTPSGKIIKSELRKLARRHWEDRRRNGHAREPMANL